MNLSITQVPAWLSILFIICFSTFPIFLIANTVKTVYEKVNESFGKTLRIRILLFYLSYFIIIPFFN